MPTDKAKVWLGVFHPRAPTKLIGRQTESNRRSLETGQPLKADGYLKNQLGLTIELRAGFVMDEIH